MRNCLDWKSVFDEQFQEAEKAFWGEFYGVRHFIKNERKPMDYLAVAQKDFAKVMELGAKVGPVIDQLKVGLVKVAAATHEIIPPLEKAAEPATLIPGPVGKVAVITEAGLAAIDAFLIEVGTLAASAKPTTTPPVVEAQIPAPTPIF